MLINLKDVHRAFEIGGYILVHGEFDFEKGLCERSGADF